MVSPFVDDGVATHIAPEIVAEIYVLVVPHLDIDLRIGNGGVDLEL